MEHNVQFNWTQYSIQFSKYFCSSYQRLSYPWSRLLGEISVQTCSCVLLRLTPVKGRWRKQDWAEGDELWWHPNKDFSWSLPSLLEVSLSWHEWLGLQLPTLISHWVSTTQKRDMFGVACFFQWGILFKKIHIPPVFIAALFTIMRTWKQPQFSSVTQLCPTLCDPMNCSTPGLPVHYQLPEFTQTHVHWFSDAIQPSHPLSSPSLAFNLSQHQGLFKWVSSSHQVFEVLEFQLQPQSFKWPFRTDFL